MALQQTNIEFITELMENHGPLMQAFIIDSCLKGAQAMIEAGPNAWDDTDHIISCEAWFETAKILEEAIKNRGK